MFQIHDGGEGIGRVLRLLDAEAGSEAALAPNYGFNLFSWKVGGREWLYHEPGFPRADLKGTRNGTPILAPFPNRIRGGTFSFGGKNYDLPKNEANGNAIHGFVFDQAWRVVETATDGAARVRGEFHLRVDRPTALALWPADFTLSVTYELRGWRLATIVEVANVDRGPLPFGFGTHPYFRLPDDPEQCTITVPASQWVELTGCLPTGRVLPIPERVDLRRPTTLGERVLDDVVTGLVPPASGVIEHRLADRSTGTQLTIRHGDDLPFTVVFTPAHRQAVCIEPYTCVTDAINLGREIGSSGIGSGWLEIPAGARRRWEINYEVAASNG